MNIVWNLNFISQSQLPPEATITIFATCQNSQTFRNCVNFVVLLENSYCMKLIPNENLLKNSIFIA